MEPVSNVEAPGFSTWRDDHVGVPAITLSEYEVDIWTPPGITAALVKFDHVSRTRPVAGSTSASSLSASSRASTAGDPVNCPVGLLAGGISNGPAHVWPQSLERCMPSVCVSPPCGLGSTTRIEK